MQHTGIKTRAQHDDTATAAQSSQKVDNMALFVFLVAIRGSPKGFTAGGEIGNCWLYSATHCPSLVT